MADAPGWFGKLAMLGDFAQRRLPEPVVARLDRWLSATMQALPGVLGERWPQAYLQAPLLRFAWGPGVVSPQWWFGVLMPSCDRVGRYFPLVVAQAGGGAPGDGAALARLQDWYAALGQAAVGTLDDGASLEAFEAALAGQGLPALEAGPAPVPQALDDALAPLAAAALAERLAGQTLWWPAGVTAGLQCSAGLPDAARSARLLSAGA